MLLYENIEEIYLIIVLKYSRTSVARTLMARLPWLFQTRS